MSGQTYLVAAYLGMIAALGNWTWTVFARSRTLESKIKSLENALSNDESE